MLQRGGTLSPGPARCGPKSPSLLLPFSLSPLLPSPLPPSSFIPAFNNKILVYHGVVQIRLLLRLFFPHFSWKTALKTVFSGFLGRATSRTDLPNWGCGFWPKIAIPSPTRGAMRQANNFANFPHSLCAGSPLQLCVWRTTWHGSNQGNTLAAGLCRERTPCRSATRAAARSRRRCVLFRPGFVRCGPAWSRFVPSIFLLLVMISVN